MESTDPAAGGTSLEDTFADASEASFQNGDLGAGSGCTSADEMADVVDRRSVSRKSVARSGLRDAMLTRSNGRECCLGLMLSPRASKLRSLVEHWTTGVHSWSLIA